MYFTKFAWNGRFIILSSVQKSVRVYVQIYSAMDFTQAPPFNLSTSVHFTMTEDDSLPKSIVVLETAPGQPNLRESVVTFSGSIPADDKAFRESVVTFSHINPRDTARSFSSNTTRTIVVDASQHLEAGSTSSGQLIPGVKDMTKGMQDVARSAKHCVKIFRVDNEIFEVNEEQLDRVRMSKCESEGVGG
jgi:hypothetical protein